MIPSMSKNGNNGLQKDKLINFLINAKRTIKIYPLLLKKWLKR
jgi:hypothetical protein